MCPNSGESESVDPLAVLQSQINTLKGEDKEKLEEFMFNKSRLLGSVPLSALVSRVSCSPPEPTHLSRVYRLLTASIRWLRGWRRAAPCGGSSIGIRDLF
jgi:hypothetical protein